MANKIVPYQWVLQESARTIVCPFALSQRAGAQGSGLVLFSVLLLVTDQRSLLLLRPLLLCSQLSVCNWVDRFR